MTIKYDPRKFYVYAYLNPLKPGTYSVGSVTLNYRPFYVGKGTGARLEDHLREANGLIPITNKQKVDMVRSVIECGNSPLIVKVRDNLTHPEALALEKQLIDGFGITLHGGLLSNISLGNTAQTWNSDLITFIYMVLSNEKDRLSHAANDLENQILELPKGCPQVKRRGNQEYLYLASRFGDKIKFAYAGKCGSKKEINIRSQIDKRDQLINKLAPLLSELQNINRLLYTIEKGINPILEDDTLDNQA